MPAGHFAAFALVMPAALACGACTSAEVGEPGTGSGADAGGGGGGGNLPDGGGGFEPRPDAASLPPPDAGVITLTQSGNLDVIGFTSVACFDEDDIEQVNSFYRVFDLPAAGITGEVEVSKVTFGVEECTSGGAGLTATVLLHTLGGNFDESQDQFNLGDLSPLTNVETLIPDVPFPPEGQAGGRLHEVPIQATVPAGSRLVVEVAHTGFNSGQLLLMGSNEGSQDGFTYTRASACGFGQPTNADTIIDEFGDQVVMHWVLVVDGTTGG